MPLRLRLIALFAFLYIVALTVGGCAAAPPPVATTTSIAALPATETTAPATETTAPATATVAPPTAEPATATATPAAQSRAIILTREGTLQAIAPDGGTATMLTTLPTTTLQFELSPNGAMVAFALDDMLHVRTLATGADAAVADLPYGFSDLRWSPDSTRLLYAFETGDDVSDVRPELWLATIDGQPPKQIGAGFGPAWSPDSTLVAFVGAPFEGSPPFGGGPGGVAMLAAADGSNARKVGSEAIYPGWQPLVWSANGTRLGAGNEVIDAKSGAVAFRVPLGDHTHISGIQAIAPDGRSVAFWRNLRIDDPDSSAGFVERDALVLIDEHGQERNLALSDKNDCPCLPVGGQIVPAWSPAGDAIIVPLPGGRAQLFASDGTPGAMLPTADATADEDSKPRWDADGQVMLLTMYGNKSSQVWAFTTDGQPPRLLGNGVGLGWLK